MTTHIVKIQRPLASSEPNPHWMIYAKGHVHTELRRGDHLPAHVHEAMQGRPKAYFEAEWTGKEWRIGQRAPDQDW